jgi:hypothetical protein
MVFPNVCRELGGTLLKFFGFYNESCSAPAPAPVPATFIGLLIFFPDALGAASRARFLYQKKNTKHQKRILGSNTPLPFGQANLVLSS